MQWPHVLIPAFVTQIMHMTDCLLSRLHCLQGFMLLRDLLAIEPIITLNAAFCERHLKACSPSEQLTQACTRVSCPSAIPVNQAAGCCRLQSQGDACPPQSRDCRALGSTQPDSTQDSLKMLVLVQQAATSRHPRD